MSFLDVRTAPQWLGQDYRVEWLAVVMVIGFLLSLVALGLLWLLKRYDPALQVNVVRMHLVALMVVPVMCAAWNRPPLPIINLAQEETPARESVPGDVRQDRTPVTPTSEFHEFGRESDVARRGFTSTATPVSAEQPIVGFANNGSRLPQWFVAIWLVVLIVLALRHMVAHVRTYQWSRHFAREGTERVDAMVQEMGISDAAFAVSNELESPITIGIFCPTVVVPASAGDWSQGELQMALQHEIAHVRRRDVFWCTLLDIATAFYWPLLSVWMLRRKCCRLTELVCDDAVLKSENRGVDYAAFLARIASKPARNFAVSGLMMVERSFVRHRIERVLDGTGSYVKAHVFLTALLPALIGALTLMLVAMRPSFFDAKSDPTVGEEIAAPQSLDDDTSVARLLSPTKWDAQAVAIDAANDVVVVTNATDIRWPLDFGNREHFPDRHSRPRVLAIGTSAELTKSLKSKTVDALVSCQPYGFGYRSIELLAKSTLKGDGPQRVRIPPKLVRYVDANALGRDLSLIRSGEGPELTKDWYEEESSSPEIRQMKVSIPSGSVWWDIFQAGAQRAAQQGNLPITFNRIQTPVSDADRDHVGPHVYIRREGGFGVVSPMKPNDWGYSRRADPEPFEVQLVTDIDWIAYQVLLFIQSSGERPQRIWLWHPDNDGALASGIVESINRQIGSFAFREPATTGPNLERRSD